ncbi:MAG: hypothetical protein ACI4MQ_06640 [Candidatus Coproplasma sp.]
MDKLEFELINPFNEGESWAVCNNLTRKLGTKVLINGKDIVETVNEKSGFLRHGHIAPDIVYRSLISAQEDCDDEAYLGLCNDCGDLGCDPIVCLVIDNDCSIVWVVGNKSDYKMLAFEFDRKEYESAVAKLGEKLIGGNNEG